MFTSLAIENIELHWRQQLVPNVEFFDVLYQSMSITMLEVAVAPVAAYAPAR